MSDKKKSDEQQPVDPAKVCPSCGQPNPATRSTCERCGSAL